MSLDLAIVGARVRTLDPARPTATAVGVRDGRIAVVGDDAAVRAEGDARTEVVDLAGAALVPGLTDSHIHPFLGARQARGADLLSAHTLEEVRARLAAVDPERDGGWVLGWGLDYNVFADGIRWDAVAEVVGDRPAFLVFMDAHVALASPRALELAGVDGPRDFGEGAQVVVDAAGRPTGELREWAALALVSEHIPERSADVLHAAYVAQLRAFAAVGLTGLHAMDGGLADHDLLRRLEAEGDLPLRVRVPFWVTPETEREQWAEWAAQRDARGHRWEGGTAKFFIDGVIDAGTAWLFAPDADGDGTQAFWPDPDRYREAVAFFARHGFQCATHAIGDRAVRETLDAYRDAGAAPVRDALHRLEHLETIEPVEAPRFAAEGVAASMQAQHMLGVTGEDNWSRRLGPERAGRGFQTRVVRGHGAVVPLGSDWPVAHYDPREGLSAARLRRPPGDASQPPLDDQALDGLAALEGYTTHAARVIGAHGRRGRIAVGLDADLTALAEDPVDVDADALVHVPIRLTVVEGEITHRAEG